MEVVETKEVHVWYEDSKIREIIIDNEKWMSAVDVAEALGYKNPSRDVRGILNRNIERFQGGSKLSPLKNNKGGTQKSWLLNLEGVIMLCMISHTDKAIPFQKWAVKELKKSISNIPDDIQIAIKKKRIKFTDQLKDHGLNKPHEYINITNSMKDKLGLKGIKKADCDLIQKMKIAVAEDIATINLLQSEADNYYKVKPICDKSAELASISTAKGVLK
jgi:prophage antirepressor-like protein